MSEEKEQDVEKLVEEQTKQEDAGGATVTADAELDQRKNKSGRVGLVISSFG